MSINLATETIISLSQAPKHLPPSYTGRPVSFPTIWRWALSGILGTNGQRVRLETLRLGGRLVTSMEALQRFGEQLSARAPIADKPRSPGTRRRASERASKALSEIGI
jgi:hypothetical protein